MSRAGPVLVVFVAGLLLLGTAPAVAQPVVSLGGIMVNYLELRRQAQLTHKKVLAAESVHAELVAAAIGASEAERAADTEWRNQAVRFNQAITDAVHDFTSDLLQVGGTSDREKVVAPEASGLPPTLVRWAATEADDQTLAGSCSASGAAARLPRNVPAAISAPTTAMPAAPMNAADTPVVSALTSPS